MKTTNTWVSVNDALPINKQRVLCYTKYGRYIVADFHSSNEKFSENDRAFYRAHTEVLYWMQLPPPPKEKGILDATMKERKFTATYRGLDYIGIRKVIDGKDYILIPDMTHLPGRPHPTYKHFALYNLVKEEIVNYAEI